MSMYAAAKTWADNHPEHVVPAGFAVRGYSWIVALNGDGSQITVTRAGDGKRPLKEPLPSRQRTSASVPLLVHDKVSYLLGRFVDPKRGEVAKPERPPMYRGVLAECHDATGDPLIASVLSWFDSRPVVPELEAIADESFKVTVDGRDPVEPGSAPAQWWVAHLSRDAKTEGSALVLCTLCGVEAPPSRLIPLIKGVEGGNTAGASLTSINNDVFASYGRSKDSAFPICPGCAHGATTALNHFTANRDHHLRLAGSTVVWWQPEPAAPFDLRTLLSSEDGPKDVKERLSARRAGRRASTTLRPERFCTAILTGNAGRISVTGWVDTTVPDIERRLDAYFARATVVDRGDLLRPPTFTQLARATLADHAKTLRWEPARRLIASLLQSVLSGSTRPPAGLAVAILNRTRQGRVTHARAAALKLTICPPDYPDPESFMSRLNPDHPSAAYQCGRLLAVIERIQSDALGGTNATVIDKYYGTFSSRPNVVFGRLVNGAQPHLSKLRKSKPGMAVNRERELSDVIARITSVPATLTLEEQAEFTLGFYHQRQHRFSPSKTTAPASADGETTDAELEAAP